MARDFERHPSNGERFHLESFNNFRGGPWATSPGHEQDDNKSHIILPETKGPIIPLEASQERFFYSPRRIALRQEHVIKAGFTAGCQGSLDINASIGGMRGTATHNEACRKSEEGYLGRTKSKRMAAFDAYITERCQV